MEHKHEESELIARIKAAGFRITKPRVLIIEAMEEASKPHTIREIAAKVAVDEASVYRTIALLEEEGFAEAIAMTDGTYAYMLHSGPHHHHLVCTSCGAVAHIACDDELPKISLKGTGFKKILDHEVTFYGLCKACA